LRFYEVKKASKVQVEGYEGWFHVLHIQERPAELVRAKRANEIKEFDFPSYKIKKVEK
jgi:hypothetical protein